MTADRGVVLVAVLWAVAVLGLLAHGLVSDTTIAAKAEHNAWLAVMMERDAEAALALAALALTDPRADPPWLPDRTVHRVAFHGAAIEVAVQDELGKIDLNYADDGLLLGLLTSAGVAPEPAAVLRDRIVRWRAATEEALSDDDRGPVAPRHGPFQSVGELALVPGITADLYARLRPAVTVYAQARTIDRRLAPREALLALPEMTAAEAERLVASPSQDPAEYGLDGQSPALVGSRAYAVMMTVRRDAGHLTRTAIVRLTPGGPKPMLVLSWGAQ